MQLFAATIRAIRRLDFHLDLNDSGACGASIKLVPDAKPATPKDICLFVHRDQTV
jgi:hypothetical protein